MVPVCMLEAVATTFSTLMGTLSRPCSLRSATRMECLLEMMRKALVWLSALQVWLSAVRRYPETQLQA